MTDLPLKQSFQWEASAMTSTERAPSARRGELLDAAYAYVLEHGHADVSLRPLAAAVGSSPRVLLFLFGSKDGLVRALLARARDDELAALAGAGGAADAVWAWLVAPEHRALLRLWVEAYARSLVDPAGPWAGFAERTVADWLDVLAPAGDDADRTLLLAVLRGALLDLLATGDAERTTAAVERFLS
jgi:AcrR family transcriptional regulator